jgi:NAD(P)-dependent dehydrogenase (short-subunit alcohol dehydrogenase family)
MMQDVSGKVAFITGGASGMGLGMARVFSAAGMRVAIADVREDHLEAALRLFREPHPGVHAIRVDVADRKAMAHAAVETEQLFGKIHVLCNNAGVGLIGSLTEASYDDWDWAMGVNLDGVFNGIHEFVPRIRSHGEGGHIVTTASMGGLFAAGNAGIYNASKYAAVALMEQLRPELAPHGIGVSAFCPGLVNTNIHEVERLRPTRYARTGYAAHAAEQAAREQFMKSRILPAGMDPMEVGRRVLQGIRRNDLYILTHPEYEPGLRERFEALLAAMPLEAGPPAARVAAEAVVLRNPLFAQERDRSLLARAAEAHAHAQGQAQATQAPARSRRQTAAKPVRTAPHSPKPVTQRAVKPAPARLAQRLARSTARGGSARRRPR